MAASPAPVTTAGADASAPGWLGHVIEGTLGLAKSWIGLLTA